MRANSPRAPQPAMTIDGVIEWGEWWRLVYESCGHETWFDRVACRLFEPERVEQVVLSYYAECQSCAWSSKLPASGTLKGAEPASPTL
jgi:hypothetical protein